MKPKAKKQKTSRRVSIIGNCCEICHTEVNEPVKCLVDHCPSIFHLLCLAQFSLRDNETEIVPINVECPNCKMVAVWGDLVKREKVFRSFLVNDPEKSPFLGINRI